MLRGVILVFSGVMLGFRRVIFGSEGLYRVQWGYVDYAYIGAGSAYMVNIYKQVFVF